MKLLKISSLILLTMLLYTSCNKVKKSRKKLKGLWNIESLQYINSYNGNCGTTGTNAYYDQKFLNAGTIEFTNTEIGDDFGEKTYSGTVSYKYNDVNNVEYSSTENFEYYTFKHEDGIRMVYINESKFQYDIYLIKDQKNKSVSISQHDSYDCHNESVYFELSK